MTDRRSIDAYALGQQLEASWRLAERKQDGIFYTSERLSAFVAAAALADLDSDGGELKILDPACGAGAFLVAIDRALVGSARLFGADLLPRTIEVAQQALASRSARFSVGDSLDGELFERLGQPPCSFDLVVGNPPWGAQSSGRQNLDSWERFFALSLQALRPGGRLALVLPDTLFSPEKAGARKLLLENTKIEKLHNLGPDWFGGGVRMGTVLVQARVGAAGTGDCYDALLLHGSARRRAIAGEISLAELEARESRRIPQARSLSRPDFALEIFRDERDDQLMDRMDAASQSLAAVCTRARGEEMAKSGLLWKCMNCGALNNPGVKAKGGGFKATNCKQCGESLSEPAEPVYLVTTARSERSVSFIDGDDLPGRYKAAEASRWLDLDAGFKLKPAETYAGPKILVRQAGVGVAATLDDSDARCPQSVYIYRVRPEQAQWTNEWVLAVLLSRAMAYYVFKRFAEVDPARAHAKLTHERLAGLPIPRLDPGLREQIGKDVRALLRGEARLGGEEDWRIEAAVRDSYGLTARDGAHVDAQLRSLPRSQAITELFPELK